MEQANSVPPVSDLVGLSRLKVQTLSGAGQSWLECLGSFMVKWKKFCSSVCVSKPSILICEGARDLRQNLRKFSFENEKHTLKANKDSIPCPPNFTHAFSWSCYKAEDSLKNVSFKLCHCSYIPFFYIA